MTQEDLLPPFFQTPSGAITVAMKSLHDTGTYTCQDGFQEIRVVRTDTVFLVHLLGSFEGSWIVQVPRYRRVTMYECVPEPIETTIRIVK